MTDADRQRMRDIGIAMSPPLGQRHGLSFMEVLALTAKLSRAPAPSYDHELAEEVAYQDHCRMYRELLSRNAARCRRR